MGNAGSPSAVRAGTITPSLSLADITEFAFCRRRSMPAAPIGLSLWAWTC